MSEKRPDIESVTQGCVLKRWYWLKTELVAEARRLGLSSTGGKFAILDRIAHFHDTGETQTREAKLPKPQSDFDWHSADLTLDTLITDSYRNSQNVRRFFKKHIGDTFKFNRAFMNWMKSNAGKSLREAIDAYRDLSNQAAAPGFESEIADHNQFNQYTRDFLADNPQMGLKEVRHYWALKRQQPSESGRHRYHPMDLSLK